MAATNKSRGDRADSCSTIRSNFYSLPSTLSSPRAKPGVRHIFRREYRSECVSRRPKNNCQTPGAAAPLNAKAATAFHMATGSSLEPERTARRSVPATSWQASFILHGSPPYRTPTLPSVREPSRVTRRPASPTSRTAPHRAGRLHRCRSSVCPRSSAYHQSEPVAAKSR